jgi:hypothetical protein
LAKLREQDTAFDELVRACANLMAIYEREDSVWAIGFERARNALAAAKGERE